MAPTITPVYKDDSYYRVTTFFKRRPDISEQQCHDHWGFVHGPLVVPWALKYGICEYTQFRTPSELRKAFAARMDPAFSMPIDFDAAADFYVKSYEDYLKAYSDPYYLAVIEPDEQNFVDKGQCGGPDTRTTVVRAMTTVGQCRYILRDGQPVVDVSEAIWARWHEFYPEEKAETK
ncbi:hypothetical protein SEUCBS140593_000917 [Sporothrix eucalyptigena]|uniref:EthD domain-containing protein n=1 Tax=Sporothrix eucalyptigena TaxID=1812306 RepID=A0ABP0ATX5_9PEZI